MKILKIEIFFSGIELLLCHKHYTKLCNIRYTTNVRQESELRGNGIKMYDNNGKSFTFISDKYKPL
jgi:hypothetical protein